MGVIEVGDGPRPVRGDPGHLIEEERRVIEVDGPVANEILTGHVIGEVRDAFTMEVVIDTTIPFGNTSLRFTAIA